MESERDWERVWEGKLREKLREKDVGREDEIEVGRQRGCARVFGRERDRERRI